MSEGVHNPINTIIKYHLLFQYFPIINQYQFNNNVNNSHNKEQTTTTPTPTIINNNRTLKGRRSLSIRFLCLMLNCTYLWFSRTFSDQEIHRKFQNHFHGGISQSFIAFHQGAPGHDIENCYPLKYEVQKLVKNGMMSFEYPAPNVKANQLPAHGNSSINMVDGCLGSFRVFDV